ncbi:hypothetical protein PLICRDRAFT_175359 [Plicaturopsis crispa FD-325 SS-3]|nr:hypothetical protein PLICRDRAFT_175359 [Plicaturopsis crispa FD-325 SS-3]
MFEEICLVCGKHLADDGRAYCSDNCETADAASPSISSASSAWSSPHIEYAMGGDVPALVPSALGSALNNYRGSANRNRYSLSSSSASSASWSALTDEDEDDNALVGTEDESAYDGEAFEGSKSPRYLQPAPGLSYARRPSSTNTRSTIPLLHRRTSSGSGITSNPNSAGVPRSVPSTHSSNDDEDETASAAASPEHSRSFRDKPSSTITSKSKRSRNRASLPAYFSLLQMGSPSNRISPLSTSSGRTAGTHASPPTPKLALAGGPASRLAEPSLTASVVYASSSLEGTPRGRRRNPAPSRRSRSPRHTRSRSRSRSRSRHVTLRPLPPPALPALTAHTRGRMNSVEQVFDWTTGPASRGRPTVRRNSSPLPKMMLRDMEAPLSGSESRARGRLRAEELDRKVEAPGYGEGRSGLLARESRERRLTWRGLR